MTEQFSNNATTTINQIGGIGTSDTTVTVTSASLFPASPQFRIIIDSEIMLVTTVVGTLFTISRGVENTVVASHTNGATVAQILTAGAVQQLKLDSSNVVWTATQTTNYQVLTTDQGVGVDTTSAAVQITLPASPNDGERHLIADVGGAANTHNITVVGNGHNIIGLSTYIMTGQYNTLVVVYHAGKGIWVII